jgi:hypothetical protein
MLFHLMENLCLCSVLIFASSSNVRECDVHIWTKIWTHDVSLHKQGEQK